MTAPVRDSLPANAKLTGKAAKTAKVAHAAHAAGLAAGQQQRGVAYCHRCAACWSLCLASTQWLPAAVCSFFQNGASRLR